MTALGNISLAHPLAMSGVDQSLDSFFRTLGSGPGVIVVIGLIFVIGLAIVRPGTKWGLIAALLWVCSLGYPGNERAMNYLAVPLEQFRAIGRGLAGCLLLILLICKGEDNLPWRTKTIPMALWIFFLFQTIFSFRVISEDNLSRGVVGAFLFLLIFLVFAIRLGQWLQNWDNVHALLYGVVGAGALLALGILYQLRINGSEVMANNRLMGTTGNPQHLGMHLSAVILPCCYLLVRPGATRMAQSILAALLGIFVVYLIWTGSRRLWLFRSWACCCCSDGISGGFCLSRRSSR